MANDLYKKQVFQACENMHIPFDGWASYSDGFNVYLWPSSGKWTFEIEIPTQKIFLIGARRALLDALYGTLLSWSGRKLAETTAVRQVRQKDIDSAQAFLDHLMAICEREGAMAIA